MSNKLSVRKSLLLVGLMIFITIVIQIFGLLKSSYLTKIFGVSAQLGAFNFVNNITMIIFDMISAAIVTVVIPNLIKKEYKAISILLNYIYALVIIFSVMVYVFRVPLIRIISGNSDVIFLNYSQKIVVVVLLANFMLSIYGFITVLHQIKNSYLYPKLIQMSSACIVVLILFFNQNINVYMFAVVVCVLNMFNIFILLIPKSRLEFKYHFSFDTSDGSFRLMFKNMLPIFISTGVYQVSLLIDSGLASRFGVAQITMMSIAVQIVTMVSSLITGNVITFLYPKLAHKLISGIDRGVFFKEFKRLSMMVVILMIFVVLVYFVIGKTILAYLFLSSKFIKQDVDILFYLVSILILGIPFAALRDLSYRVFYAIEDTRTPVVNSVIATMFNIVSSILFAYYFGLIGIVVGTLVATVISAVIIYIRLFKKFNLVNYA